MATLSYLKQYLAVALLSSSGDDRKSLLRQVMEWVLLFANSRLGPGFYYLARMDVKDVPLKTVLAYASVRAYNRAVHRANDRTYHRASQHKAIEKAVLTTYGIRTPELILYAESICGHTCSGKPATSAAAVAQALMSLEPGTRICFKQAHGWGGGGFRTAALGGAGRLTDGATGTSHDLESYLMDIFYDSPEGFIIEKYVEQSAFYASLNPSSVNSFRILIFDRNGENCPWLFAFLRVGREGALVDNASSGGLILPVNPKTLALEAGFAIKEAQIRYDEHPDTGAPLAGISPPGFDEAVNLALDAVRAFPGIRFAGVDVAMSIDGPVVLELNVWPDYSGFAECRVPSKPAFVGRI